MSKRRNIASGVRYEELVGYSRAVRHGNRIEVSGTTALSDGQVVGAGNPTEQTRFVLQKIAMAIQDAGGAMEDVIRTRMYVTNINDWEAIGKAHQEFFGKIKPATTMVEISRLIHPDLVIEIEATAMTES